VLARNGESPASASTDNGAQKIVRTDQRQSSRTLKKAQAAKRAREYRERKKLAVVGVTPTSAKKSTSHVDGMTITVTLAAISLACVSAFFGVCGMVAIYAAATVPIALMTATIEGAKMVTAAWLSQHWHTAPRLLRLPLVTMVLALMTLTSIGVYGYLSRAHLEHQTEAVTSIERDAAPIEQQLEIASAAARDVDVRISQVDDAVTGSIKRGRTAAAMALVADQAKRRAELEAQRQLAAGKVADLKVELSAIDRQRASVASESGPANYIAKLFGSDDTENVVRLITALLVIVLDPLAVLLAIAAATRRRAP
jgi:hypothetical protein